MLRTLFLSCISLISILFIDMFSWTEGVGNDPREDRYFSIPKQVRIPHLSSVCLCLLECTIDVPLSLRYICRKYVTIESCFVQSATYDPEGEYVAHWLPSLKQLPQKQRNSPGDAYLKPIVPLKFGMGGGGGKPNNYSRFGNKNRSVGKVSRR